ncbi:MAG: family transcriptional regulator, cyclic receptor protein [Chthoniobacter sp.]|jgi:CRP-like cAMP-binding protein|nr:family transcriptional regulator, cyclic receptor protein [Chthoniobacter sp.]
MSSILDLLEGGVVRHFATGEVILEQGQRTGVLLFLTEGAVEVVKDGVQVATASKPGAVFGEISALLGGNHTATVRALQPSSFHVVENPRAFLEASPLVCLHVCELVARRLEALTTYLVDVKQQFGGDDHIGIVDAVLETLLHREPPQRIRPSESTIRQRELSD